MKLTFNVPIPGRFELLLAKVFGVKRVSNCMNTFIETYYWRGKFYVAKQWTENPEPRSDEG